MMVEIWKAIQGYEGLYQVSNLGNVKSLNWANKGFPQNLYLKKHCRGYLQVELSKNGKKTMITVHRLVANAFLSNPQGLPVINHKDENKRNNCVDNLEWCTHSQNMMCYFANHDSPNSKPLNVHEVIAQKDLDGNVLKIWENAITIKHSLGLNEWAIRECCRGNRNTAYGYKWQFAT